jgi:secreted trypsin-like serine protease
MALLIGLVISGNSILGVSQPSALAEPADDTVVLPIGGKPGNPTDDSTGEEDSSATPVDVIDPAADIVPKRAGENPLDSEPSGFSSGSIDGPIQSRVVGGTGWAIADAPWQVALVSASSVSDYDGHFCGGSIINSYWILSAAHCLEDVAAGDIVVAAGSSTLGSELSGRTVDRIVRHPGYNSSSFRNDIALLRLASPLTFSETISAIRIAERKPRVNTEATITGWGSTWMSSGGGPPLNYYGTPQFPEDLHGAMLRVLSDSTCGRSFSNYHKPTMLCSGSPGYFIDSCQGDSGGPLVTGSGENSVLAGITSFGRGCAWTTPGVYTNVAGYTQWIRSTAFSFATQTPTILGLPVVGETLTVEVPAWTPAASMSYQWLLNDKAVKRATGSAYVVGSKDVGKRVSVRVTGSAPSYVKASVISAHTGVVNR